MATTIPYDTWAEWAPAYGIHDDVPDPAGWVRISLPLRALAVGHGVERTVGRVEAGEFEVLFGDPARSMDPWNRQGPNWDALQSRRPFRIRAQASFFHSPKTLLRGYTRGLPVPDWHMGDVAVRLRGVDVLGVLGQEIKGTVFDRVAAALAPDYWIPLDEGGGITANARAGPPAANTLTVGAGNLMPYGDQPSISFPQTGSRSDLALPAPVLVPPEFTILVIVTGASDTDEQVLFSAGGYDPTNTPYGDVSLMLNHAGFVAPNTALTIGAAPGKDRRVQAGANTNTPTMYVARVNPTTLTIDATADEVLGGGNTARSAFVTPGTGGFRLGNTMNPALDKPLKGSMSHFLFWNRRLSDAERSALHDAFVIPLRDRRSDEHVAWILDQLGIPAARRSLETGTTRMGSLRLGAPASEILGRIAATEGGRFFGSRDGVYTFHAANHTPIVGGTFDTRPPAGSDHMALADLTLVADERTFFTEARTQISTPTPKEVVFTHPNAETQGVVAFTAPTQFRNSAEAHGRAQGIVGDGLPHLDVVDAKIVGGAYNVEWDDVLAPDLLDLDVGHQLGFVARVPSSEDAPAGERMEWGVAPFWGGPEGWAGPGPIERDGRVLYVRHEADFRDKRWETTLDLEGVG